MGHGKLEQKKGGEKKGGEGGGTPFHAAAPFSRSAFDAKGEGGEDRKGGGEKGKKKERGISPRRLIPLTLILLPRKEKKQRKQVMFSH